MTQEKLRMLCDQAVQLALMAMLLAVPLVFNTYTHDVFETNKLTACRLFTLLALVAYLTAAFLGGGVAWRPSSLWPPIVAVGISSLLSTLHTNNLWGSIFGVYEDYEGILTILLYMLIWFLAHQHLRGLRDIQKFIVIIILAGLLSALYGIAQNFNIDFVMWNPLTYSSTRLFGSLGNPNFLAAYTLMALPLAALFFLISRRPSVKALMLAIVVVMVITIFFTQSRGAFLALLAEAILFALYLLYDHRHSGTVLAANRRWLLVLGLLAGLTLFSPQIRSTMIQTINRTVVSTLNLSQIKLTPRLYIWRSALQIMRDHPWLGCGLDTFQITFPKYRLAEYWQLEWNGTPEKAHSFFLQIGATTGLIGLGVWLWLLTAYFVVMGRQFLQSQGLQRHLTFAVGVAQIGFIVQNQFSFTVVAYGSLFWFLLGLGPAISRQEPADVPLAVLARTPFSLARIPLGRWMMYLAALSLSIAIMVLSLRGWMADVFFKQGMILLMRGMPQAALQAMSRAVALQPYREIYWVKYGIANEEAAKREREKQPFLQRAVDIHQHTISLNPLNGYDFNNVGRVYKFWGDYLNPQRWQDAETACRKAAELDPYNVYFALDLASVHISQQRWPEVQNIANRLVTLFPDFAVPYAYLGYVALVKNDVEEAYRRLTEATTKNWRGDMNTQATTWSNLGIVRARRGEYEGALEAFKQALNAKPHYLEARLNLALILEQQGQLREAAAEYRYIVEKAPQYPKVGELKQKIEKLERGIP